MSDIKKIVGELKKLVAEKDIKIITAQQPLPLRRRVSRPQRQESDIFIIDYMDRMR